MCWQCDHIGWCEIVYNKRYVHDLDIDYYRNSWMFIPPAGTGPRNENLFGDIFCSNVHSKGGKKKKEVFLCDCSRDPNPSLPATTSVCLYVNLISYSERYFMSYISWQYQSMLKSRKSEEFFRKCSRDIQNFCHVLPNARLPILSQVSLSFPSFASLGQPLSSGPSGRRDV